MRHQSVFAYTLTRQYPYRWFTPVVIVGGIVSTVIFTLLNFSSNSVVLRTILTADRNSTENEYAWFQRAPWSWRQELEMKCENANVVLGTRLFTSNNALSYTLDSVYDEEGRALPSLSYAQNVLEDCQVSLIDIQFIRADTATPAIGWWSWRFTDATVRAHCRVDTDAGPRFTNLSMALGTHAEDIDFLIDKHDTITPAKWWGAAVTQAYYMLMTPQMARQSPEGDSSKSIDYMRARLQPRGGGSFEERDFFSMRYQWQASDGQYRDTTHLQNGTSWPPVSTFYNRFNESTCSSDDSTCYLVPDVTNEVEGFSSALYSLVMIDLGRIEQPNILTQPELLQRYLSGTGNERGNPTGGRALYSTPSKINTGEVLMPYAWSNYTDLHDLSSSAATKATIYSQYTCSVPQVRDGLTIFLNVLVADMVFLSALWTVLNWATTMYLTRTEDKAMHCEGEIVDDEAHGLTRLTSQVTSKASFYAVSQENDLEEGTRLQFTPLKPNTSET